MDSKSWSQDLLRLSAFNCWGQADAVFAVAMAKANSEGKTGLCAAEKHLAANCCILFQLVGPGTPPSVHAFLLIRDGAKVLVAQALQDAELPMHVTRELTVEEAKKELQGLRNTLGRRCKLLWSELRLDRLCGLDLSSCFQDTDRVCLRVTSVARPNR